MLELQKVSKTYRSGFLRKDNRKVLEDVDLTVERGSILGLVGESGSGKTTLAKVALRLVEASSGSIRLDGEDITHLKRSQLQRIRNQIQIVFQHPETALDPQFRLRESLQEAFLRSGVPRRGLAERIDEECHRLNLPVELLDRYPSQVSGGEVQRAALARVLIFKPRYLFMDEPTSMLDISVQAHILSLVREIANAERIGVVIISHDLDVVRAMCKEVAVLHRGRVMETGPTDQVLSRPKERSTKDLLQAWEAQGRLIPG